MKAILVDSKNETVSEIEIGNDYREIGKAGGFDLFTCIDLGNGETAYVDDEGLLTQNEETTFFQFLGHNQPIAGNAVILGTNLGSGKSRSTALSPALVKLGVRFLGHIEVEIPEPQVIVF